MTNYFKKNYNSHFEIKRDVIFIYDVFYLVDIENIEGDNRPNELIHLLYDIIHKKDIHQIVFVSIYESVDVSIRFFIHEVFNNFYENLKKTINFYFIFGSLESDIIYKKYDISNHFYHWPHIFLFEIQNEKRLWSKSINEETNQRYTFISMNNTPRYHRIKLIDYIAKYNLWDNGLISLNGIEDISNHDFKYWKHPKRLRIDTDIDELDIGASIDENSPYKNRMKFEKIPIQYHHSKIDIVTETSFLEYQYTEKILKPILLQKPFIIVGKDGINTKLSQIYGFELYDELFDYKFYDNLKNLDNRLDFLCRWLKQDEIIICERTKQKLIQNRQHLDVLRKQPTYFIDSKGNIVTEQSFENKIGFSIKDILKIHNSKDNVNRQVTVI